MPLPNHTQIRGSRPHWLLDLVIGGARYRIADEALEVPTADGRTLDYAAGLDPAIEVTLTGGPVSVPIALDGATPDDGTPWALILARGGGGTLTGARAELRRWWESQTFEEARWIVSGAVTEPEIGTADDEFEFAIERLGDEVVATIPPAEARIDETTVPIVVAAAGAFVPSPDPASRGLYYPWIFGTPGRDTDTLFGTISVSSEGAPAYIVSYYEETSYQYSMWVIAGHPVQATTVRITDLTAGYGRHSIPAADLVVSTVTDLRGREIAVASIGADEVILQMLRGNEYSVTYQPGYGGGIYNADRTGPMRAAGEIAQYMLREVGEVVDAGRMAATRAYLDRFTLDFALREPTKARAWVDENLGRFLPLLWRESEDGIWLDVVRYDPTLPIALRLVEREDLEDDDPDDGVPVVRSGRPKGGDPRNVVNDVTVQYAPINSGEYRKRLRIAAPGTADTAVENEYPTWRAGISESRHKLRAQILQLPAVCDDATAELAGAEYLLWKAVTRRTLTVTGEPQDLDVLDVNTRVSYSSARLYITEAPANVKTITLGLAEDRVSFELLDDPGSP